MADTRDLLVEIGTEELPPTALDRLSLAFMQGIEQGLKQEELTFAEIKRYASPRRLAVLVTGLATSQEDRIVERKGPALKAAFDDAGNPSKAAEGFARSCGVTVEQLEHQESPKGTWLVFKQKQSGKQSSELVPAIINKSLSTLPIPKRMRWGSRSEEFVRPVHWALLLFGDEIIPTEILGHQTGRTTRGHRFHRPETIEINAPADYLGQLQEQGMVYADMEQRKELIRQQVIETARAQNARAVIDEDLLNEVSALNEWPVPVMGSFDESFLEVPAEALIQAMQGHQKYFPVVAEDGRLLPNFITISNIESQDINQVRSGNERVISPRFKDAAFFWEQDLKHPLENHQERLKGVVFQDKLGNLYDKSQRVAKLAAAIAEQSGSDPALALRAGELCKCDLMTNMVNEFPKLQGIMGSYYATRSGEDTEVATAMQEVYLPRHAGDNLPASSCGQAIAVADRLDTMLGIFAIGQKPTGVKDPFGLRRAALGVLRIIIETPLDLDLEALLRLAAAGLADRVDAETAVNDVFDYMMDRLKAYYIDRGITADVIDAVLACRPTRPADFDLRVKAVTEFRKLPEAESLSAANKRIRNILRKSDEEYPEQPDAKIFEEDAERLLHRKVSELTPVVEPLFAAGDYTQALKLLAALREAVDGFFDQVMVNCEDAEQRRNRLALLNSLGAMFLSAADLSRLQ
ncbi:MAG: glycine--tRNA ligase subunit beta [Gammaproteobacteria bacterium]|nr:glycine--tRNA ligase subunit beta [Gammaproteobacteria bacterium]